MLRAALGVDEQRGQPTDMDMSAPTGEERKVKQPGTCKHGKCIASARDMDDYARRPSCVRRGDCDCHLCSQVCWAGECVAVLAPEAP